MKRTALLDRAYACECLDYNSETGEFRWRTRPATHFREVQVHKRWNTRYAGKIAGTRVGPGYSAIAIDDRRHLAHRLAWLLAYGEAVPDMIDHIDGDPGNNQIVNLRAATMSQNLANAKKRNDNTSGVKGVYPNKNGTFKAFIRYRGKGYHIGTFLTLGQAVTARREAAKRLQGDFARH